MITKWKIFNFKSIKKETELSLAPLTLFAGPNSSGKSTILQSMLLIAQTLAHKVGSRSVVLNGALVKLGQFDDLRSTDSEANQILVGWECKPQERTARRRIGRVPVSARRAVFMRGAEFLEDVTCEVSFDSDPGSPQREIYQLQPRLFSLNLTATSRGEDYADIRSSISLSQASGAEMDVSNKLSRFDDVPVDDALRSALNYDARIDDDSLAELKDEWSSAQVIGCDLRHFLPSRVALQVNLVEEVAQMVVSSLLGEPPRALRLRRRPLAESEAVIPGKALEKLGGILVAARSDKSLLSPTFEALFFGGQEGTVTFREWFDRYRRLPPGERDSIRKMLEESDFLVEKIIREVSDEISSNPQLTSWRLPSSLTEAVSYLDEFFSGSVKYLGPLRDEPKPLYPLATSVDPSDVGLRGELTAAVLDLHKDATIRYVKSSNFKAPAIVGQTASRTLLAAVTDWVQYLGVAEGVLTRDRGKLGHEMKVRVAKDGKAQDLTHVGVGVSQVLPILVMSLLADEDTTLIFEQPELHLHPKVQTLLGDFFLSMSLLGKQCIVETHSEYLINRLRFRAASAPLERSLIEVMKIYFVEKSDETSTFKEIVVNDYGAIPDWPEGFFDQSQYEAEEILKAATRKRKTLRKNKNNADRKH